jgi:hypothetical protein
LFGGLGTVIGFLPEILVLFFFILRWKSPAICRARRSCSIA